MTNNINRLSDLIDQFAYLVVNPKYQERSTPKKVQRLFEEFKTFNYESQLTEADILRFYKKTENCIKRIENRSLVETIIDFFRKIFTNSKTINQFVTEKTPFSGIYFSSFLRQESQKKEAREEFESLKGKLLKTFAQQKDQIEKDLNRINYTIKDGKGKVIFKKIVDSETTTPPANFEQFKEALDSLKGGAPFQIPSSDQPTDPLLEHLLLAAQQGTFVSSLGEAIRGLQTEDPNLMPLQGQSPLPPSITISKEEETDTYLVTAEKSFDIFNMQTRDRIKNAFIARSTYRIAPNGAPLSFSIEFIPTPKKT